MAQATTLTDEQRETLNAAEQILVDLLVPGEVLMCSLHAGWAGMSTSYFTPNHVQHTPLWRDGCKALADKIDYALELRADEEGRAEQVKAERVAALKAELADLPYQRRDLRRRFADRLEASQLEFAARP